MNNITIPPEAVEATAVELAPHPWSMYKDTAKDHFRDKARAAILAALKAWPGMNTGPNIYGRQDAMMHIPLQQENADE